MSDSPLSSKGEAMRAYESGCQQTAPPRHVYDAGNQDPAVQAEEKMEAIGRLASGVAHDFNNLLTVISGYGQMLQDAIRREASPEKLGVYVEELRGAADRAAHLTDQLLAFSRRSKRQPQRFDLNKLVENSRQTLKAVLGRNIDVLANLCPEPCFIVADPLQIEQILANLARVARDSMPIGGRFLLTTDLERRGELDSTCVVLECGDTGCGIDSSACDRIFEPYFAFKPDGRGVGLTLATVHGMVKQSQGDITVRSEPDQGTTFSMYFPQVSAELAEQIERNPSAAADDLRGDATVLIVEDDDTVRSLVKRMLERYGYETLVADGAREALQLFRAHQTRIGLLLTDMVMPETGGRELATQLRGVAPKLKILYMSGFIEEQHLDGQGAYKSNTLLLRKPFTPEVLARHVRRALDAPPSAV